jgi:hypothetical protein
MPSDVHYVAIQSPQPGDQDQCELDVFYLFGDAPVGATPVHPQQSMAVQDRSLPRITVSSRPDSRPMPVDRQQRGRTVMIDNDSRQTRLLSNDGETPFSGGFCRQLAAMYTDVGMTTVERVRWLSGWMILVYALTCCAWFAWPAYTVPLVGVLAGTLGLLACQRPHERGYLVYVLAFLALNYAQLVLLVWLLFVVLPADYTTTCAENCAGAEAEAVFLVLLVIATGLFHWRVVLTTRHYVREFRMMEQLAVGASDAYFFNASYSDAADSSTVVTDAQSRSSASAVSASVVEDTEQNATVSYRSEYPQQSRL